MATRMVTAMFGTRAAAERAVNALRLGVSLEPGAVHIAASDTSKSGETARNAVFVTAMVEPDQTFRGIDIFRRHGATDIRHSEADDP